jgi:hypothetical protein
MLCKPATLILLISVAGALFHVLTGQFRVVMWWVIVGIIGTGTFEGLCMANFENAAWFLMVIPVLVVCFFFAVALLASSLRINNVVDVPCGSCKQIQPKSKCPEKPRCHNKPKCGKCGPRSDL